MNNALEIIVLVARPPATGGLATRSRFSQKATIFLVIFFVLNFLFLIPKLTRAADDYGLSETAAEAGLKPAQEITVAALGGRFAGYLLSFVGVIFFVLMIYGGILWMTARGAEEQIKKAQELIKSAIMGLVIVFLAYAVTNFVITNLLSATK